MYGKQPPSKRLDTGPDPHQVNKFGNNDFRPPSAAVSTILSDLLLGRMQEGAEKLIQHYQSFRFNVAGMFTTLSNAIQYLLEMPVNGFNYLWMYQSYRTYSSLMADFRRSFEHSATIGPINLMERGAVDDLALVLAHMDATSGEFVLAFDTFITKMQNFNESTIRFDRHNNVVAPVNIFEEIVEFEMGTKKNRFKQTPIEREKEESEMHMLRELEPGEARASQTVQSFYISTSDKVYTDQALHDMEFRKFIYQREKYIKEVEELWPQYRQQVGAFIAQERLVEQVVMDMQDIKIQQFMAENEDMPDKDKNLWVAALKKEGREIAEDLIQTRHIVLQNEGASKAIERIKRESAELLAKKLKSNDKLYEYYKTEAIKRVKSKNLGNAEESAMLDAEFEILSRDKQYSEQRLNLMIEDDNRNRTNAYLSQMHVYKASQ
jgi:hypothetical protein